MKVIIHAGTSEAVIAPPASKSLLHRLVIASSLAHGTSFLSGADLSDDIRATLSIVSSWSSFTLAGRDLSIRGKTFKAPRRMLDAGESGTTLRLLLPLLATFSVPVSITGHGRLLSRPLAVYDELFRAKGVAFSHDEESATIQGPLPPGDYEIAGNVSSQFASGLLYSLPLLEGDSTLRLVPPVVSRGYIDLTLEVLSQTGITIHEKGNEFQIPGHQSYTPLSVRVEPDWSQAAPFLVLGALRGGVGLSGLSPSSAQGDREILPMLTRAGARVHWDGPILKSEKSTLVSFHEDLSATPDLAPALMVASAFANEESRYSGVLRLRDKESDRLSSLIALMHALGASTRLEGDALAITPGTRPQGVVTLPVAHDHRLVQAASVASCLLDGVIITDALAVDKSYPSFFADLACFGFSVERAD